jgi:penicillin-binding protein 1A
LKLYQYILILFGLTAGGVFGTRAYILDVIEKGPIPSIEELENPEQSLTSRVYSKDGKLLDYYFKQKRVNLTIDEIPQGFVNSLLATEDRKFFEHWGLNVERIVKAVVKRILLGQRAGASTITQQLARTLYLDQAPTLDRKIREAYTAIELEKRYTKDEILEMYINGVYYGAGAYGLYMAANNYFGKRPLDLNTQEIAYLVGVINAPGRFDSFRNYERGKKRRNVVLSMMRDWNVISDGQFQELKASEIELYFGDKENSTSSLAPHFIEAIRQKLGKEEKLINYDLYKDGLTIYTTLDSRIQEYANTAVEEHMEYYQKLFDKNFSWKNFKDIEKEIIREAILKHPKYRKANKDIKPDISRELRKDKNFIDSVKNAASTIQCGVVVLDPKTGSILAMVGASPKFMKQNTHAKHSLNHVTQIKRQPGSSVKPFVYALAMDEHNLTPQDSISCSSYTWYHPSDPSITWSPQVGYDYGTDSIVTLEFALKKSINSVAARLITQYTSPQNVKNTLVNAGVKSKLIAVPPIALGAGGEVRPIEIGSALSVFNNNGLHVEPFYLTKIEDQFGNTIKEKNKSTVITDVLDPDIANMVSRMLEKVVSQGTAGRVRKYFDNWNINVAGKTGTTNDNADAWFTGYTPELLCSVWVGFDDQRLNFDVIGKNGQGGRAAGPIFGKIMKKIYEDKDLPYKKREFDYKKYQNDTISVGGARAVKVTSD